MNAAKMKCRVCGKEYEGCRTQNKSIGTFRWQSVACSPECGEIYLQQIIDSRNTIKPKKITRKKKAPDVVEHLIAVEHIEDTPAE